MLHIDTQAIAEMQHLYRINLINGITGYKSANLIGTIDEDGGTNLAVFSSVTHFGSNPALIGLVLRPTTIARNTYDNIKKTGYYTINHIPGHLVGAAHHTSAKYDPEISEFDKTAFNPVYLKEFSAPYVQESAIKMGMEFLEEIPIKANGTILILGQLKDLWFSDAALVAEDGFVDLNAADTACISGLDAYHRPSMLDRFHYARPDKAVETMPMDKKHQP